MQIPEHWSAEIAFNLLQSFPKFSHADILGLVRQCQTDAYNSGFEAGRMDAIKKSEIATRFAPKDNALPVGNVKSPQWPNPHDDE